MASHTLSNEASESFVHPGTGKPHPGPSTQSGISSRSKGILQKSIKRKAKILGVFQILFALLILACGIAMLISRHPPFIVYSGYSFWGSIFFIVSGSFSIAAERKPICQQSSLETNIISTILAGIGIITASSNLSITAMGIYHQEKYDSAENAFLLSVLLILIILEFCIAIALTNFKCKMSCVNFSESEGYLPSNSNEPEIALHERVYEHLTSGSLDYDQLNFQK